jgi:hypothetical protein
MRQELGKSTDGDIARGNGHNASRHGVADEQERTKYSTGPADGFATRGKRVSFVCQAGWRKTAEVGGKKMLKGLGSLHNI